MKIKQLQVRCTLNDEGCCWGPGIEKKVVANTSARVYGNETMNYISSPGKVFFKMNLLRILVGMQ